MSDRDVSFRSEADEPAVRAADHGAERKAFLRLPYALYRDDPAFVPPLLAEREELISPRHNAFFQHAEVALFLAGDAKHPRGRISVQLDAEEERFQGIRGACFGLFEAVDEPASRALLARAESWARERGALRLRGPFSLSINQESGLLVEGFDLAPMILMPHGRPEYAGYLERAGFVKARDLYAWRISAHKPVPRLERIAERTLRTPGLKLRQLDPRRLHVELQAVRSVFNEAWASNWGFVPLTDAEIAALARGLGRVMDPRLTLVAEADGQPVAIGIGLPNLNEAIADLGGRLLPLGWLRLLWRLKVRGLGSARLALMGALEDWRAAAGRGLPVLMLYELRRRSIELGYREWEISWLLEDNRAANLIAELAGADRVKTYRIYEKLLGGEGEPG